MPDEPNNPLLRWRAPQAADFDAWFALLERIESYDRNAERTRRQELDVLDRRSWIDLAADARLGIDGDGVVRAFACNELPPGATRDLSVSLRGGVDPEWRGKGIGRALLEWQRTRARDMVTAARDADPAVAQLPSRFVRGVEEQVGDHRRLLEAAGFTAARWFLQLRRKLTPDADAGVSEFAVDGLRVQPFDDGVAERVRIAHNEAFQDHWGSNPHTAEHWRSEVLEDDTFRPGMSFAIVDVTEPGEPVAAYVLNCEFEHSWKILGFSEGYTVAIGVRRPWRGKSLAKFLLGLSAREFARAGHPYAGLEVDAQNPSGALGLYESLGYQTVHRAASYSLDG